MHLSHHSAGRHILFPKDGSITFSFANDVGYGAGTPVANEVYVTMMKSQRNCRFCCSPAVLTVLHLFILFDSMSVPKERGDFVYISIMGCPLSVFDFPRGESLFLMRNFACISLYISDMVVIEQLQEICTLLNTSFQTRSPDQYKCILSHIASIQVILAVWRSSIFGISFKAGMEAVLMVISHDLQLYVKHRMHNFIRLLIS